LQGTASYETGMPSQQKPVMTILSNDYKTLGKKRRTTDMTTN